MLVSAAIITAIVAVAAAVWQVARDDAPRPTAAPATWDAVAFVGSATGDITLVEPDGVVVARHAGEGRVSAVHAAGSHLALVQPDRVGVLDLAAGADSTRDDIALPERSRVVTRLATNRDQLLLAAGNRTGGAIRVIDAETGAAYDLADLAHLADPLLYTGTLRVDPEGTTVAVADAASFQTIVVSGLGAAAGTDDTPNEPAIDNYAAQPLAVGERLLATTQVVGGRADVSVHPLGGPKSAPVPMDIPAGGIIIDGRLLAVTTDGSVVAIRVGDRQPRQLSTLALPTDATVTAVYPAADGQRLVVYAESYVAVLDPDGAIVFEATFPPPTVRRVTTTTTTTTMAPARPTVPSPGGVTSGPRPSTPTTAAPPVNTTPAAGAPLEPSEPLVPAREWTCLAVGLGTRAATLISLDDGAELAELDHLAVSATSADGCVVLGTDGDTTVVTGTAGYGELGETRTATLSPDGRLVVLQRADRATELVPLGDDLTPGTPVDVTDDVPTSAYSIAFVER